MRPPPKSVSSIARPLRAQDSQASSCQGSLDEPDADAAGQPGLLLRGDVQKDYFGLTSKWGVELAKSP